jgi:putative glutamine amidotransferase
MHAVIGLSSRPADLDRRFGKLRADTVARSCTAALGAARGTPLLLPADRADEADAMLERVDGLILTGGGDIDPSTYRREPRPSIAGSDIDRDRFEIQLVRAAREWAVPVLAICRSLQVANVACGGDDLIVDIAAEVPGGVGHRAREPGHLATHRVRLDPHSRLAWPGPPTGLSRRSRPSATAGGCSACTGTPSSHPGKTRQRGGHSRGS